MVMRSKNIISYQRNRVKNQPWAADAKQKIAINDTININNPCQKLVTPIKSNSGLNIIIQYI